MLAFALAPGDPTLGDLDRPLDLGIRWRGLLRRGRGEEVRGDGRHGGCVPCACACARLRLRLRAGDRVRAVLRRGRRRGDVDRVQGGGGWCARKGAGGEGDRGEVVVRDGGGRRWRAERGRVRVRVEWVRRAEVVGRAGAGAGEGAGAVVRRRRGRVERLRVALEEVELAAGGTRARRKARGDDGGGRGGRREAEGPCGEGRGGKVGCVREPSPVVMGGGEEDRGDEEVLEEANGDGRVVRLAEIRGQGGDKHGELAWDTRHRRSQGSNSVVGRACKRAERALVAIGNPFPS